MPRPYPLTDYKTLSLEGDTIIVTDIRDRDAQTIELSKVILVRLVLEDDRGTCTLHTADGVAQVIRSFRVEGHKYVAIGATEYRRVVADVHRALARCAPRARFVAGSWFKWVLGRVALGMAAVLAASACGIAAVLGEHSTWLVIGTLAGAGVFGVSGVATNAQREVAYQPLDVPSSHLPRER